MQRFDYSEDFHFELLDETEGVSLERIDYSASENDPNNWASASSTSGFATPGAINSQSDQNLQEQLGNDCFKAEPMVFSPDFDGRDDFTNIIYGCNATGKVANVLIYDALGRKVRTLTQNETLATSGVIRWDGTNDRGEKVRIGYYLIYLEVFDLSGNVTRQQLKVAVTGRFR